MLRMFGLGEGSAVNVESEIGWGEERTNEGFDVRPICQQIAVPAIRHP